MKRVTVFKKQELIGRWDSERALFYDDIAPISFNKLDDS